MGGVHAPNATPSSEQSKREPASPAVKAKAAVLEATVPVGPESIVVSGAAVSSVQVSSAGVGSALPAASIARARKLCGPSERPV
jgi:hypothetical protein